MGVAFARDGALLLNSSGISHTELHSSLLVLLNARVANTGVCIIGVVNALVDTTAKADDIAANDFIVTNFMSYSSHHNLLIYCDQ
jgi:hypothetical protein